MNISECFFVFYTYIYTRSHVGTHTQTRAYVIELYSRVECKRMLLWDRAEVSSQGEEI